MSPPAARVLLLEDDPAVTAVFREAFGGESGVRLSVATDVGAALRIVAAAPPHLVIASDRLLADRDWALPKLVHRSAEEHGIIVMVADPEARERRHEALERGVDEILLRPVDVADVRAKARGMLRLKRAYDRVNEDREELEKLHAALRDSFEQLLQLMAHIVDLSLPGAGDRSRRIADLADAVADRFEVPGELRRDLNIAARLHELGHVMMAGSEHGRSTVGTEAWPAMAATRAVFDGIEGLEGAAEVLGAVCENWDGTGLPTHRQQGQIPLRSRILRVAIDYVRAMEAPGGAHSAQVLESMTEHRGSRYDPLALAYLEAVVSGGAASAGNPDRVVVAIAALEVGMVLADDLYTESGLKLLARGTRLGPAALEAIQRRDRAEPILHGAAVFRKVA